MVFDANEKEIVEDYDGIAKTGEEHRWADLLLAGKISVAGGGVIAEWHRGSLMSSNRFKKFEKRWKEWWENKGKVKYKKEVELAEKEFRKQYVYVEDEDAYYSRDLIESELTDDEIHWIKKLYRNRKKMKIF